MATAEQIRKLQAELIAAKREGDAPTVARLTAELKTASAEYNRQQALIAPKIVEPYQEKGIYEEPTPTPKTTTVTAPTPMPTPTPPPTETKDEEISRLVAQAETEKEIQVEKQTAAAQQKAVQERVMLTRLVGTGEEAEYGIEAQRAFLKPITEKEQEARRKVAGEMAKEFGYGLIPVYGTYRSASQLKDNWDDLSGFDKGMGVAMTTLSGVGDALLVGAAAKTSLKLVSGGRTVKLTKITSDPAEFLTSPGAKTIVSSTSQTYLDDVFEATSKLPRVTQVAPATTDGAAAFVKTAPYVKAQKVTRVLVVEDVIDAKEIAQIVKQIRASGIKNVKLQSVHHAKITKAEAQALAKQLNVAKGGKGTVTTADDIAKLNARADIKEVEAARKALQASLRKEGVQTKTILPSTPKKGSLKNVKTVEKEVVLEPKPSGGINYGGDAPGFYGGGKLGVKTRTRAVTSRTNITAGQQKPIVFAISPSAGGVVISGDTLPIPDPSKIPTKVPEPVTKPEPTTQPTPGKPTTPTTPVKPSPTPTIPQKPTPSKPVTPQPTPAPSPKPTTPTKPGVQPAPKPGVAPRPAPKPGERPGIAPLEKPGVSPRIGPYAQPGTHPRTGPLVRPDVFPETRPMTQPQTKPQTKPATRTATQTAGAALGVPAAARLTRYKLPNKQTLPPGLYPRVVMVPQGIADQYLDVDTGQRWWKRRKSNWKQNPWLGFKVITVDKTPPLPRVWPMGVVNIHVQPRKLDKYTPRKRFTDKRFRSRGL